MDMPLYNKQWKHYYFFLFIMSSLYYEPCNLLFTYLVWTYHLLKISIKMPPKLGHFDPFHASLTQIHFYVQICISGTVYPNIMKLGVYRHLCESVSILPKLCHFDLPVHFILHWRRFTFTSIFVYQVLYALPSCSLGLLIHPRESVSIPPKLGYST